MFVKKGIRFNTVFQTEQTGQRTEFENTRHEIIATSK